MRQQTVEHPAKMISALVEGDTVDQVVTLARSRERSFSAEVRVALRAHLERTRAEEVEES